MLYRFFISFIAANVITLLIVVNQGADNSAVSEFNNQTRIDPPLPIFAVGLVEGARPEIELHFETDARVKEVFVEEGDRVTAGQLLATLDTDEHHLQLRIAASRLAAARADLQAAKVSNPEEIAVWEAKLKAKQAELRRELKSLDRNSELLQRDAIAEQAYDDQFALAEVLKAEVESLHAQVRKLDSPSTEQTLDILRAEISAAEISVQLAELQLSRCKLVAPCDGVIVEVDIESGELIRRYPEIRPAFKLVDDSRRRIVAYVEEPDALRVSEGMEAHVHIRGSDHSVPLVGTVTLAHPQFYTKKVVNRRTDERFDVRTRECWIELEPHPDLILGAHADVLIERSK